MEQLSENVRIAHQYSPCLTGFRVLSEILSPKPDFVGLLEDAKGSMERQRFFGVHSHNHQLLRGLWLRQSRAGKYPGW